MTKTATLPAASAAAAASDGDEEAQHTSLASIYRARKSGEAGSAVNALKERFQTQIETRVANTSNDRPCTGHRPRRPTPTPVTPMKRATDVPRLAREKSFDEARTAVQSQIERMFQKAAADAQKRRGCGPVSAAPRIGLLGGIATAGSPPEVVASSVAIAISDKEENFKDEGEPIEELLVESGASRYTAHGVSHLTADDEELREVAPPPVHHGITLEVSEYCNYGLAFKYFAGAGLDRTAQTCGRRARRRR